MIPVRSELRSNVREIGLGQHRDEHRRHAVQARAALARRRAAWRSGSKLSAGKTIAAPWVVRRGCPSPCRSSGTRAPGCRPGRARCSGSLGATKYPLLRMLWWVSVAPLGKPVVPLVYWMLIGSSSRVRPSARARRRRAGPGQPLLPVGRAEEHRPLQVGQLAAHLFHHRRVIGGLERLGGDQQPAARLAEHVLELAGPVGRVDVDQDDPELGRGVLDQDPLGAVRAPDPEPITPLSPAAIPPASSSTASPSSAYV